MPMAFRPLPDAELLRNTGRQSPRMAMADPRLVAPLSLKVQSKMRGSERNIVTPLPALARTVQLEMSTGGALSKRMFSLKPPAPAHSTMQFSITLLVPAVEVKLNTFHCPGCFTGLSEVNRIGLPPVPRATSVP